MDEIELIKEKINIVDLIQEYLPLKKAGVNFKTNCPFHQEKTPSFVVSPERQIWHCFGCSRGGDIFKFLMEKEGVDFKEALETLAQKAGVVLKRGNRRQATGINDKLYEINSKAGQFFHFLLTDHPLGKKALDYLVKRGLTPETIKTFQLGYAPQNWESLGNFLKKRGFSDKELIISGLGVPSKRGSYDRFRGRIVFPLYDLRDRVIGFSGRVLDNSLPKYINTPQTPIFDKSKLLYGLNLTKGAIREAKSAILVEGEMDMILSFQSGVKNVAATKGTALTQSHIETLKKYTDTLSLCFDMDLAGDSAGRRGIDMAEQANFNIQVIQLEQGKDPGELCLKNPEAWEKSVKEALPIYDYYLNSVETRFDLNSAFGKKAAFAELLPIWKKITDPVLRDHYVQKLSALVKLKEDAVRAELAKVRPDSGSWREKIAAKGLDQSDPDQPDALLDRRATLEEYLIALLLHLPQSCQYVPSFPETLFTTESLKGLYVLLVLHLDSISFKGQSFKIADFVKSLPEETLERVDRLYLMQLDDKLVDDRAWQKEVEGVISELKKMLIKSSLEKLTLDIKNAQEYSKMETLEVLNKRFRDLSVKLKNL